MQDMIRKSASIRIREQLAILFMSLCMFLPHSTNAASAIADSPCDAKYYDSLSARAWLEAQREITQNQNLILKPDSVFEYTCFDRLAYELADHADEMFSETRNYGAPLSTTSMDSALQGLVGASIISYINNNFGSKSSGGYNLLGGHIAASGISHQPRSINSGPSYSCDVMERVWQAAKCINFISYPDFDGFYTFQEYSTGADKRHLPTACTPISSNWDTNLQAALTNTQWTKDPVNTYMDQVSAPTCSGCKCSGDPIPTGITVFQSSGEGGTSARTYEEKMCLQPGCYFDSTRNGCYTP